MLSKREKNIGIIACAIFGLLALDRILVTPLWTRITEADARIEAAQDSLIETNHLFQRELAARRDWKTQAGDTLPSDAPSAQIQLLNLSRDWGQSAGLSLASLKPERDEKEQGYQKITIRVTATGSMRQVSRFLYSIQTARVPVRVSDFSIASRREGMDELTVQLGLATIYLPPEAFRSGSLEASR